MYLVYIIYYSFCDLGEEVFVKRYLLLRCGSLFFFCWGGGTFLGEGNYRRCTANFCFLFYPFYLVQYLCNYNFISY